MINRNIYKQRCVNCFQHYFVVGTKEKCCKLNSIFEYKLTKTKDPEKEN